MPPEKENLLFSVGIERDSWHEMSQWYQVFIVVILVIVSVVKKFAEKRKLHATIISWDNEELVLFSFILLVNITLILVQ